MKWIPAFAACLFLGACAGAQEKELTPEVAKQVMTAFQTEDYDTVIELTPGIEGESKWTRVRATAPASRVTALSVLTCDPCPAVPSVSSRSQARPC